jgi:LytS/YehU family sensor histidine kinase
MSFTGNGVGKSIAFPQIERQSRKIRSSINRAQIWSNNAVLLLNPLIENAIKHGVRRGTKPLKILIRTGLKGDRLRLEISNSGNLKNGENGTGIGLKNVRERLANLYGDEGSFELTEDDGFVCALINIPVSETN